MSRVSTSTAIASSSAEPAGDVAPLLAWGRLAALAGWSALVITTWGALTLLALPFADVRHAVRRMIFRGWARGVAVLLGLKVRIDGEVPQAPFFLVSNHLSYLDIVTYAAVMPARFVAKREVRSWPAVGLLARAMATIFIDRTVKRDAVRVQGSLARAIADGDGVVVFAEATSSAGHEVLPFRPALLEWAAQSGSPVHHASVGYRTSAGSIPAHLSVCWWGEMTFGRHLAALARLPWIEATVRFGDAPIAERDRKRLADLLHQAVSARFIPVVLEPE
jgi:1-acyl-sn-glycerol-3-phosphate acyltransferase